MSPAQISKVNIPKDSPTTTCPCACQEVTCPTDGFILGWRECTTAPCGESPASVPTIRHTGRGVAFSFFGDQPARNFVVLVLGHDVTRDELVGSVVWTPRDDFVRIRAAHSRQGD